MLEERQQSILRAVIEEYIRTAHPIASRELARDFNWGLSPATIRNELLELDEQGFLEQPHTSAGRVPTDKGYRFFVDHLTAEKDLTPEEEALLREAFAIRHTEEFLHIFAKTVAAIAGTFAAAGMAREHIFYKSGFSAMLEEPEFTDPERARGFGRLAEIFDAEIHRMLPRARARERIWIGAENPCREARRYAVFLAPWEHPGGFRGFVSIVAPTRTNYAKHKAIISTIRASL